MSAGELHLAEDIIIKAVIDENDLSRKDLEHLAQCEICMSKKRELEDTLSGFTLLANDLAPEPVRPFSLEEEKKSVGWTAPVFATAVILMVIVAGLFFGIPGSKSPVKEKAYTVAELMVEMETNQRLVADVMALEENIMPEIYSVLAGNTVSDQYDEFIDFVFPLEEEINGA